MSLIYQAGTLNTTALTVPNLYVQIAQPQALSLAGSATSKLGIVGTAGWGPVNVPVPLGTMSDYVAAFGAKQKRITDAGIALNIAATQGASSFVVVRVTDGSDEAATGTLDGVTVQAVHTGAAGNAINVAVTATGSGFALLVSHANLGTTSYSANDWSGLEQVVSQDLNALIRIQLPATVPTLGVGSVVLSGGVDGGTPTPSSFLGQDSQARTGLYALRGQGCSVACMHGVTDSTLWAAQAAFGLNEGVYVIAATQVSDSISNAVAVKAAAGVDSVALKLMFGDWLYWNDDTYGMMLVSPQAFAAGMLAALSPEQSSLNKALSGVVGSQKAGLNGSSTSYSNAELSALFTAGLDVICNPAPGGAYWAVRCGHNTSSNAVVNSDAYTRLTNYLSASLAGGMGRYVGQVINDTLYGDIRATLLGFLSSLLGQGILGLQDGQLPYSVVCDGTNNPQSRTALGYVQADIAVRYQGINEKFIVNLQGGASVSVSTVGGSV
ncbi:phage tail sheath protein [Neokomagataea thailandica NBRC 106555]|uniref:Phage tail protein n=2 Tax=Neokomagataea TaxID=1223423 RepID=A0A4Y6V308_9PROT|nr:MULTISPECIES: phage tail protein [Neokomagataea]QDH24452.1 phage tail protein [Neokomagataea tanensis]GBR54994.1 phage tail sheath protein [Neokomagataea thailandica NBRC 106555]